MAVSPTSIVPEADLAARVGPQLRRIRVGLAASLIALAAAVVTSWTFVAWTSQAQTWPLILLVGQILLAGVCGLQWWVWLLARARWSGEWAGQLGGLVGTSVSAHALSWPVVVGTALAAIAIAADAGWSVTAVSAGLSIASSVVAQLFGSSQHLRLDGPADTVAPDFAGRL